MSDDTYEGWTNYETWAVNLWFNGDEASYSRWYGAMRAIVLAVLLAVMLAGCGGGPAPVERHGFYYGQEEQRL